MPPAAFFAAVGDNCIDRYLPPIGHSTVGGNAVNVAVQAAGMGLQSACFTAVGKDADGVRTIAALRDAGVDTSFVLERDGLPTAWTDLTLDATGDRQIGHEEFGACRGYLPDADAMARLRQAAHVHLGWLDDGGATALALSAAGVSLSLDVAVNPNIVAGAIVFASGTERTAEAQIARAQSQGAALVVVTLGGEGAIAAEGLTRLRSHADPVAVLDTLGAGDSFATGFLVARLSGQPLQGCLEQGHAAAARTCSHWGGFPQPVSPL